MEVESPLELLQIPLYLGLLEPTHPQILLLTSPLLPRLLSIMENGNNTQMPVVSEEPRLTLGRSEACVCSFCNKTFTSLQALGGHQTRHRKEIEEMRRQHEAFMGAQRLRLAPSGIYSPSLDHNQPRAMEPISSSKPSMVLLAPNHAFWEACWKTGEHPQVIDYIGGAKHGTEDDKQDGAEMDHSSENTVTDPNLCGQTHVEKGEEASSVNLDLTL